MNQLDEVFDENTKTYQANNIKPNLKLPQVWQFSVPGNDRLAARMVSFLSDGDSVKNVKMGDKFVQVFLMSLSEKGNPGELKGGLGSDPIGAITTIFDTVYEQAKRYKFDAVLFRLPIKKMKGQANAVQRIMARLAVQRTGGKFVVLKELWGHSSKYAYVLIRRKNVNLEDIKGIPKVNPDLYETRETKAGPVFVEKKTGNPVTKDEAIAVTIAKVEDSRTTDRAIAAKTKISRRAFISSQYALQADTEKWESDVIKRREKLNDTPPTYETSNEKESSEMDEIAVSAAKPVKLMAKTGINQVGKIGSRGFDPDPQVAQQFDRVRNILIPWVKNPANIRDVENQSKAILTKYYNVVSKYDGKNTMDILKNISAILIKDFPNMDAESRVRASRTMMNSFVEDLIPTLQKSYARLTKKVNREFNKKLVKSEKDTIREYCEKGFEPMNDFLIGKSEENSRVRDVLIPNMDSAFSKGIVLPKKTILYRGMTLGKKILSKSIDEKIFYFTNYVSTSLSPGFIMKSSDTIDSKNDSIDADEASGEEVTSVYNDGSIIYVGLTISDADKLKVIVPGDYSKYSDECEVILPRGTFVKFTKIYAKSRELEKTGYSNIIIECNVVAPNVITENHDIYDGDTLINEGTIKRFDFGRFNESGPDRKTEKPSNIEYSQTMDAIIDMLDIENAPAKFK